MTVEIYIPKKMSDHLETGRIIRWLVREGEKVKRGQVLFEIERDNAVGGVEAPADGYAQVYPEAWLVAQAVLEQKTPDFRHCSKATGVGRVSDWESM
jgi:hypothetical protein